MNEYQQDLYWVQDTDHPDQQAVGFETYESARQFCVNEQKMGRTNSRIFWQDMEIQHLQKVDQ